GDHPRVEHFYDPADLSTDPPEAKDSNCLSFQCHARNRRPAFLAHAPVYEGNFSHERDDQTDGELFGGQSIVAWGSGDGDTSPCRGLHIKGLAGSTGLRDQL